MFSKLVLPFLGGTPSVWNTCLVFFQAALLVGYVYAYLSTRVLSAPRQRILHVAILALSCLILPLRIRTSADPPSGALGILWLLGLLAVSLGLPFVMLASGAPMAQRWLADSGHSDASDPYFLYAASNLGSLFALLSYPLLVEPRLTLSSQRAVWSAGYVVLVLLVAICAWVLGRKNLADEAVATRLTTPARPIPWRERAMWVLYAAVPSSLLIGVTSYISTDVAAVPLLWVLPLSLYLLSFVIVFARRPWVPLQWMVRVEPYVLVVVAIPIFWYMRLPGIGGIVTHLIVLFVVAMVCHGELARRRPPAAQLTEFFVWISLGGLIGGVFNALFAPVAFDAIYEYPIALALAGMLLPANGAHARFRRADLFIPLVLGAGLVLVTARLHPLPDPRSVLVTAVFAVVVFSFKERPLRFGLALAALFVAGQVRSTAAIGGTTVQHAERSFFGVYRVLQDAGTHARTLQHGTTAHGVQSLIPARRLEPQTYYHRDGPAGDVFTHTLAGMRPLRRVAIVGLGTGTLACYGRDGEQWTFYEIDPVIAHIAIDPRFFTFLRDCPPSVNIMLGDARLTLRKHGATKYDIFVLDAFNSDAIPVHLLTREAIRAYFSALAPGGVIAAHISNRHLDLEPVIGAIASEMGIAARVRRDVQISPAEEVATGRTESVWVILARESADFRDLAADNRWQPLRRRADVAAWTDDYSNIIRVFDWH
jgi:spermidine synthase